MVMYIVPMFAYREAIHFNCHPRVMCMYVMVHGLIFKKKNYIGEGHAFAIAFGTTGGTALGALILGLVVGGIVFATVDDQRQVFVLE